GVLGEQGGGERAAAFQRGNRFARDQRLAAQDAVLVRKGEADDFEIALLDDADEAARRLLLLGRPQAVALDKTQRGVPPEALKTSSKVRHCEERKRRSNP